MSLRPRPGARALLAAALLLGSTCWVAAHVRLIHPSNGNPLYWLNPHGVSIVIGEAGSDDLAHEQHRPALQAAIQAWNEAAGSRARLIEDDSPAQRQRSDWQSDSIHLIQFDEDNGSGYFPSGSGIVAVTPVYFFSSGRISDADVLFNGKDFHFTTSGLLGAFDVEDVGAHEIGHLLGLNHSGWAGATMYPYVDPSILLHRSISSDDAMGLCEAYPDDTYAALSGHLLRSSGAVARGAQVVARDPSGRPVAAVLSDEHGDFRLPLLAGGTYSLYAAPLDGPVVPFNLGSEYVVDLDFAATLLGEHTLADGAVAELGTFHLAEPQELSAGRVADDYPLRAVRGQSRVLRVRGAGFGASCTVRASDPALVVHSPYWNESSVEFVLEAEPSAATGHVDLELRDSAGHLSIITGAIEVTPPDPVVDSVSPSSADASGGVQVLVRGAHFQHGLRVVIGDRIYSEGEASGAVLLDGGTLELTLGETIGGRHDVVVIDESGVEGRLPGALLVVSQPAIAEVFPAAGHADGGTLVRITGEGFAPGAVVTIDGMVQPALEVETPESLAFVTEKGPLGGPYTLLVTNPGGASSSASFSFVATPDPLVLAVDPPQGSVSGGETVLVHGSSFTPAAEVRFGVDPISGGGGIPAQQVIYIDESTLRVLTPSMGSGTKSVLVRDTSTEQATLLTDAYTYVGSEDHGGGCFGLGSTAGSGPARPLANGGWVLVLLAYAGLRRRRAVAAAG